MKLSLRQQRRLKQLIESVVVLAPLLAATYYGAYLLRFTGEPSARYWAVLLATLPWVVLVKWAVFGWFKVYEGWSTFVTFGDLAVLIRAATVATLGVTLIDSLLFPRLAIPRGIILIDWGTTLLAVGALRALPRLLRDGRCNWSGGTGTMSLIVGANSSGEALLRSICENPELGYRIAGFIDDRAELQGVRIGGAPVLGTYEELPAVAATHDVEEVLITSGELSGKQVRDLVDTGQRHGFRVKVVPSFEQLLTGRVSVQPRAVAIEDLLCRPSVNLNLEGVAEWIEDRVVLVTGSAGSIGSEICRQLLALRPRRVVLLDRSETGQFFLERELRRKNPPFEIDVRLGDLNNARRLDLLFREVRPEIIFHAAAYKHVPLLEAHCGEAIRNIVLATRNVVDLADYHGARAVVMISTDKAVDPTSIMGGCKRLAEQYVQARAATSDCRYVTVRFGNVLDSSGSVVPIFREQIARGGPVTVTHAEMTRYFMLIPEAAQLVIQGGAMGRGGEIFVLDMGEPVRILDLAHDMIRLSGFRVGDDIEVRITGLRPGEKLYEELYEASEERRATAHPKIMAACASPRPLFEVIRDISRLEQVVDEPNEAVRAALWATLAHGAEVPERTAPPSRVAA